MYGIQYCSFRGGGASFANRLRQYRQFALVAGDGAPQRDRGRMALGASRWEIVRQLLTESVLLAILGGAVGAVVSFWGTRALAALPASTLPRINPIQIDGQVLAFAVALSLATGVLFGLLPTLQLRSLTFRRCCGKKAVLSPVAAAAALRAAFWLWCKWRYR